MRPEPGGQVPEVAMVMAAGLGKRMRPLTATRPKPLVEVAGKALLDHTLDRLRAAGVRKAVVNVHYLADAIEAHLANRVTGIETVVSDERDLLLETGGGLVRALPLIDADPFLVVNSDNLWVDGPVDSLRLLASNWDDEPDGRAAAARAARPRQLPHRHRRFPSQRNRRDPPQARGRGSALCLYGIQIISKRLFADDLPKGAFSTNLLWDHAIAQGRCFGAAHQGLWFDVGAPPNIKRTEEVLSSV
jgi:MurNAc alpha-1-phosphate uridylyltransferase